MGRAGYFRKKKKMVAGVATAAALLIFGAFRLVDSAPNIPTAVVARGDFTDYLELRGDVKALKSRTITAPYEAGDLQILKITPDGTTVKKGDIVVSFDTTTPKQMLAQDQTELKSADAEIEQSRAKARLKEEQDLTDLMKARYDMESAKLDASKREILSAIDGKEADLKLADAQQKLSEAEAKLKADKASDAADVESKRQKHDQALFDVQRTQRTLSVLVLRAPTDGIVTVLNNWRASGFIGNGAPFKQGDRAWPGAAIAEIPDLSTLQITARVDEVERGRIQAGQPLTIRADAIPDREFAGHIAQISTTASMDFSAGWPFPRDFTVQIAFDHTDPRLRPGMQANLRIATDHVREGILIPSEALFHDAGQTVAYVREGRKFVERPIEVARRSADQLLVTKGVAPGEKVALQDPTAAR
ncbi:MAG TPA: efflux RND transporter periplasmic adaptor subunit [Candidatus Acidoferrales bacterium]|nr:efflux RND transporter periplasmic adaptor subunit [Candidatus Acidoferrales bacterium]